MIIWGMTAIAVWILWEHTDDPSWNMLWLIMTALGWGITAIKRRKSGKKPSTPISKTLGRTWLSFGIFATATAIIGTLSNGGAVYEIRLPVTAMITLLLGMVSMTTGFILRNTAIIIFSASSVLPANMALTHPGPYEPLMTGMAALLMLITPRIIINIQSKRL